MIALRVALAAAVLITCAGASKASDSMLVARSHVAAADALADRDYPAVAEREGKTKERTPPPRPIVPPAGQQENPALRAECAWIGQRIVSLVFRDDPMTGNDFIPFYARFGCPDAHLTEAFACVVNAGSLENDALADRIALCWTDPHLKPAAVKPGEAKSGEVKSGDAKPGDAKPGEMKSGEPKPAEVKPAEVKPVDAKPADAKSEETKPNDGKPADAKPADAKGAGTAPAKPADGSQK